MHARVHAHTHRHTHTQWVVYAYNPGNGTQEKEFCRSLKLALTAEEQLHLIFFLKENVG